MTMRINGFNGVNQRRVGGLTDLHQALLKGDEGRMERLLRQGADPLVITDGGDSYLHYMVKNNCSPEIIVSFLNQLQVRPAELKKLVNLKDKQGDTILFHASLSGQEKLVEALLRSDADVNEKNSNGSTALHGAAFHGHAEIVYLLCHSRCRKGLPDIDVHLLASDQCSPLYYALAGRHSGAVSALLESGTIDVYQQNGPEGLTALHIAAAWGDVNVLRRLIAKAAHRGVDDVRSTNGNTPLAHAIFAGQLSSVTLLLEEGASIHATTNEGLTPAHIAVLRDHLDILKVLIETPGVNIEAKTPGNHTPLSLAALNGRQKSFEFLLERGANPFVLCNPNDANLVHLFAENGRANMLKRLLEIPGIDVNSQCRRPITFFLGPGQSLEQMRKLCAEKKWKFDEENTMTTSLYYASMRGSLEVTQILLQAGAKVDAENGPFHDTALHTAVGNNHLQVIRRLVEAGSSCDKPDLTGATPLSLTGNLGIFSYFLDKGADPNTVQGVEKSSLLHRTCSQKPFLERLLEDKRTKVDARDSSQRTPLHWAAQENKVDVAKLLLGAGADPNAVCEPAESTSLHLAVLKGNIEIVRLLCSDSRTEINKKNKKGQTPLDLAIDLNKTDIADCLRSKGGQATPKVVIRVRPEAFLDISTKAKDLLRQGYKFIDEHKLDQAYQCFKKAAKLEPNDADVLLALGNILFQQRKFEEAEKIYKKIKSEDGRVQIGLGKCAMVTGNHTKAREYLEDGLRRTLPENLGQRLSILHNLGENELSRGSRREAEVCFNRVLELSEKNTMAHLGLARAARLEGDWAKVEERLKTAFLCDTQNPSVWAQFGELALRQGKPLIEVRGIFEKVRRLNEEYSLAYTGLGEVELRGGNLEKAEQYYRQALRCDPNDFEALCGLGNVAGSRSQYAEAAKRYSEAIAIHRNCVRARVGLGEIFIRQGLLENAELYLSKAVELDPHHLEGLLKLGHVVLQYDIKRARTYFLRVLELDRKNTEALNGLGEICLREKNLAQAEIYLRTILEFDKQNFNALLGLGQVAVFQGKYLDAEKIIEKAKGIDDTHPLVWLSLGKIYFARRELKQSEEHYRHAITLDLTSPQPFIGLGELKLEQNRLQESEENFRKALGLDPKNVYACFGLGNAIFDSRPSEAKQSYLKAWQHVDPSDSHIKLALQLRLGRLAKKQGLPSEAEKHFKKALEIDPQNPEARASLLS